MVQPATVKVISSNVNDISTLTDFIKLKYPSTTTSGVIFDPKTGKYHQFLSVQVKEKVEGRSQ